MTDPKDAERLAEYDAAVVGGGCIATSDHKVCWGPFLRRLLTERDATIADLERQLVKDREARELIHRGVELIKTSELPHNRIATLETQVADLERRLAEARDIVSAASMLMRAEQTKQPQAAFHARVILNSRLARAAPPVAEASGETPAERDQRDLDAKIASAVTRRDAAPQPTADHTERAREIAKRYIAWDAGYGQNRQEALARDIIFALTAAERAGAEKAAQLLEQRSAQWGDEYNRVMPCSLTVRNELGASIAAIRALAARDAALPRKE